MGSDERNLVRPFSPSREQHVQFADRAAAGRQLAIRLGGLGFGRDVVVVGLPRGGVPVAEKVADALMAPLDVILVRKLGVPDQPELAAGAIGEDGTRVLNDEVIALAGVTAGDIDRIEARERAELERRVNLFRQVRPRLDLSERTVIVVDDGIATGATARAACLVARAHGARKVVLAVPVAPAGWEDEFAEAADQLVAVETPEHFMAVGQWYHDFSAVPDDEVIRCLQRANDADRARQTHDVVIPSGSANLAGVLTLPLQAQSAVVIAHGSGSNRHSGRNQFVASVLNDAGIATLLFDFFGDGEENDAAAGIDVDLLGRRLVSATCWLRGEVPDLADRVGYYGASSGAAAALVASTHRDGRVRAVVSRGGRPDLAAAFLAEVRVPTLLIVGSRDHEVLRLNERALADLTCPRRLVVVEGARHLFEEPGTLRQAAHLARDWFLEHLGSATG